MQERSVSYGGESFALPAPFFVLATQNPVEQAGTYPLPEAQLDRFLMFVRVAYPSIEEEKEILTRTTGTATASVDQVLNGSELIALQKLVRSVEISTPLVDYLTRIVRATRPGDSELQMVKDYLRWGAGPRAGQALVLCAKARALLSGHFAVTLEDIRSIAPAALRHRLLLNFQAEADGVSTDNIVERVFQQIDEPKSSIS